MLRPVGIGCNSFFREARGSRERRRFDIKIEGKKKTSYIKRTVPETAVDMDFSSENQSSEAGAAQAAKLGGSRKGPDAQSVTKRYVNAPDFF